MSRGMKIGLIVVVHRGRRRAASSPAGSTRRSEAGTEVRMEKVGRRDLVSAVTASGKIEAKTSVDISADITGRIIKIGGAARATW